MQRKLINEFRIGRLAAAAAVACAISAVTPASACPGGDKPYQRAALAANAASLGRLGLFGPKGLAPGDLRDAGSPAAGDPDPSAAIIGLWQVTYLAEGHVVAQAFDVFHSDGTELSVDTSPPALDNVCVGVWSQTGTFAYKLKHPSWIFDMNGNLIGTAMIRNTIMLDRSANRYSGKFTVDIYDNSGRLVEHLDGEISATRIRPD